MVMSQLQGLRQVFAQGGGQQFFKFPTINIYSDFLGNILHFLAEIIIFEAKLLCLRQKLPFLTQKLTFKRQKL